MARIEAWKAGGSQVPMVSGGSNGGVTPVVPVSLPNK